MKNERPLVSIVVPIYGVELYIKQCVKSLMEQTYNNIEYIFVNDCTQDNSILILKETIKKYNNRKYIHIINKEKNEGLPQARKTGTQHCSGEYIMHLDSDDWCELNMVEELINKAIETKSDIVYANFFTNDIPNQQPTISNSTEYIKKILQMQLAATTWSKLYKKSLFTTDIIFPTYNMHEDLVLNLQIILKAKIISHVDKPLYHYRVNPNSLTRNYNVQASIKNIELIYQFLQTHRKDLLPSLYSFYNWVRSDRIKQGINNVGRENIKKLFELIPEANKYIFQKEQFNNFKTQIYLYIFSIYIKFIL